MPGNENSYVFRSRFCTSDSHAFCRNQAGSRKTANNARWAAAKFERFSRVLNAQRTRLNRKLERPDQTNVDWAQAGLLSYPAAYNWASALRKGQQRGSISRSLQEFPAMNPRMPVRANWTPIAMMISPMNRVAVSRTNPSPRDCPPRRAMSSIVHHMTTAATETATTRLLETSALYGRPQG